ncbi:MAG: RNA-binding protein [Alphaproteobacteria bacterium]|nr:RNA-binding protein [Alphaproteobacteria bacterium]
MPKGPRGEKRPADAIGNAIKVARIAVGDIEDEIPNDGKDPAAKALGAKGGAARAKSLTAGRRSEIAKKAAAKRWKKKK